VRVSDTYMNDLFAAILYPNIASGQGSFNSGLPISCQSKEDPSDLAVQKSLITVPSFPVEMVAFSAKGL
jgi:hypothetical protein